METGSKWPYEQDRCYHGIQGDPVVNKDVDARVFVELAEYGPTERQTVVRLGELQRPDPVVAFRWGYRGSGPNNTARAILTDALGEEVEQWLWQSFTEDWLSQCPDRFRFRRPAVLRWARGLVAQHSIVGLPYALASLPPVDPGDYARRPELPRVRSGGSGWAG